MVKTFIKLISGFFEYIATESINFVLTFFSYFGKLGEIVLNMPVVETGIVYTQEVALALLALKIAYEAYMIYILRIQGEPTSDPMNLVIGAIRAGSIIVVMPWLVKYLYGFGLSMASEIAVLPNMNSLEADTSTFTLLLNLITNAGSAMVFIPIGVIFAIVMLLIIVIQNFIRSIEIAVAAWTGSFMALGLTNKESQSWNAWWQDTLTISLAAVIQIALLRLSFFTLTPITTTVGNQSLTLPGIVNLLFFISALWVTYKSPQTLKDKFASTGIGRAGGGAVQSVGQSLVMRKIMK